MTWVVVPRDPRNNPDDPRRFVLCEDESTVTYFLVELAALRAANLINCAEVEERAMLEVPDLNYAPPKEE